MDNIVDGSTKPVTVVPDLSSLPEAFGIGACAVGIVTILEASPEHLSDVSSLACVWLCYYH